MMLSHFIPYRSPEKGGGGGSGTPNVLAGAHSARDHHADAISNVRTIASHNLLNPVIGALKENEVINLFEKRKDNPIQSLLEIIRLRFPESHVPSLDITTRHVEELGKDVVTIESPAIDLVRFIEDFQRHFAGSNYYDLTEDFRIHGRIREFISAVKEQVDNLYKRESEQFQICSVYEKQDLKNSAPHKNLMLEIEALKDGTSCTEVRSKSPSFNSAQIINACLGEIENVRNNIKNVTKEILTFNQERDESLNTPLKPMTRIGRGILRGIGSYSLVINSLYAISTFAQWLPFDLAHHLTNPIQQGMSSLTDTASLVFIGLASLVGVIKGKSIVFPYGSKTKLDLVPEKQKEGQDTDEKEKDSKIQHKSRVWVQTKRGNISSSIEGGLVFLGLYEPFNLINQKLGLVNQLLTDSGGVIAAMLIFGGGAVFMNLRYKSGILLRNQRERAFEIKEKELENKRFKLFEPLLREVHRP